MPDWLRSVPRKLRAAMRRCEGEVAFLVVLVLAVYALRVADLTIRGEESRWAQVAREMMQTGDWIVPRQQGVPLLSRPPLHSWLIALAATVRGELDAVAVRLPSVLAVLLITLLVYAYSRQFLDRLGSLAAACAFATFAEILHLGRYAESEACFALLVSGPLLIWHVGYSQGWSRTATWIACYGLTALGSLTKGPQAPVYAIGGIGIYLLIRRDWRWLLCTGHVLGILAFALLIAAWQLPLANALGWASVGRLWIGDSAMRWLHPRSVGDIVRHLATYPLEVVGCLMPWSVVLVAYADRGFREKLGEARPMVLFLTTCLLVAFPTCWLTPGAMTRYFLPMYPCVAPLVGLVVQRLAEGEMPLWIAGSCRWLLGCLAVGMVAVAAAVLVVTWLPLRPSLAGWGQPAGFAIVYAVMVVTVAAAIWRLRIATGGPATRRVVVAVSCFMGLSYTSVVVNALQNRSMVAGPEVARVKAMIPPGERLVSLDRVHHLFAYYYAEPISVRPLPRKPRHCQGIAYFCLQVQDGIVPKLPFAWEEIATVAMDRNRHARPDQAVIVGRAISSAD